jgi:hypothetical protein
MTCGCSANESSSLLMNGGAKKRKSKTTLRKKSTKSKTTLRRKSTKSKTTLRRKRRMSGGGSHSILPESLTGSRIPLRVQSSPDWVPAGAAYPPPPYAIDLGEAMQSYLFGRPTPDGKSFMVASGLVENGKNVINMVGGKKKSTKKSGKKSVKKSTKKSVKKSGKKSTKSGKSKKRTTRK